MIFGLSFWDLFTDPVKFVADLIGEVVDAILKAITDPISVWFVEALVDFVQIPANRAEMLGKFGNLETLLAWTQTAAGTLATIFFIMRILTGMRDNLTGENDPNFAEIIGSYAVCIALIVATPYMIDNILIKINNVIIDGLSQSVFGGQDMVLQKGKTISDIYKFDEITEVWPRAITRIIIFIAIVGFAFAGAMRYIELILLIFLGPIFAATYTSGGSTYRSSLFRDYWVDCVAVVFTQSVQFFLLMLMMKLITTVGMGSMTNILLVIGIVFVALRGPQILRQFLGNAGAGGSLKAASATMGAPVRAASKGIYKGVRKGMSSK